MVRLGSVTLVLRCPMRCLAQCPVRCAFRSWVVSCAVLCGPMRPCAALWGPVQCFGTPHKFYIHTDKCQHAIGLLMNIN
jgi:hypothetical protein